MAILHFKIPFYLMDYFERYHKYFLEHYETRELDQTISVLLRYAIGDTKKISLKELVAIDKFFDCSEYVFSEFLQCVLSTSQTEEKLSLRS